jgi:UPF0176 protein
MNERYQIITFYKFLELRDLPRLRDRLKSSMRSNSIKGTFILAAEGFNATVCGLPGDIAAFVGEAETVLGTEIVFKSSFYSTVPFKRVDVKIKPEIVTLKKHVDVALGAGTHVDPREWNDIISDPETLVLDARNSYEYETGTFSRAVNPGTSKFSELPAYVTENLDPQKHKKIAMFCTGGIRCEKFAAYMKQSGFEEVYQLEGGILKYLEEIPAASSLWQGECFVFDDRVSVDVDLEKGVSPDLSLTASK